jgi:hypothetical protein
VPPLFFTKHVAWQEVNSAIRGLLSIPLPGDQRFNNGGRRGPHEAVASMLRNSQSREPPTIIMEAADSLRTV